MKKKNKQELVYPLDLVFDAEKLLVVNPDDWGGGEMRATDMFLLMYGYNEEKLWRFFEKAYKQAKKEKRLKVVKGLMTYNADWYGPEFGWDKD